MRPRTLVLAATLVAGCVACSPSEPPAAEVPPPAGVTVPPVGAEFDYQMGGAYPPPPGVRVVTRDHAARPAAGIYNICYVNAFQAQPDGAADWGDLVLRDANGETIVDEDWNEAVLDLRTADKRERVAAKVNAWVDGCAAAGYQAVEPDNYDSFTRSHGLLSDRDAQAYIRLLSAHAHTDGLAVAQKNTAELADRRRENGLDFAVAEECGDQDDCGEYTAAFGNHVIVVEYTSTGLTNACARWGGSLSIVRRDREVTPEGAPGHLRAVC
ncbi:hypothetical protein BJY24_005078 [Nocardia transvalensis]|uniref:Glycoside-hydrolase family GH114 TIM-barrel domain-containing protein n=1 Tax=Nocardia transvalensis TaxID=37333 RepID=A0A7W9PHA2_9NOCA|nr:endo alpha-1,4 polygalactosaminidase [Nocardia transvalensis]MBB5916166.1 hypothetical protein [Nocardia transvalensis]